MENVAPAVTHGTFWVGVMQAVGAAPDVIGPVVGLIGAVGTICVIRKTEAVRRCKVAEEAKAREEAIRAHLESEKLRLEIRALRETKIPGTDPTDPGV